MNSKSTNVYGCTNNREGREAESGGYVCCRPIEFMIETDGGELLRIDTYTDDESVL